MSEPTCKELYARLLKALPIADVMQAGGITSQEAACGNAQDWRMAANAAGYLDYTPSDATQKVITKLLLDREMAAKKFSVQLPKELSDAK